jgi:hypothetical protein
MEFDLNQITAVLLDIDVGIDLDQHAPAGKSYSAIAYGLFSREGETRAKTNGLKQVDVNAAPPGAATGGDGPHMGGRQPHIPSSVSPTPAIPPSGWRVSFFRGQPG